jgi:sugar phosphate isomerase/epimerase
MKLGVFTVLLAGMPFEEALDKLAALGVEAVEVGTGNNPGNEHCDPEGLLADPSALRAFRDAVARRGMTISALSQHGNPVHPNREVAEAAHRTWLQTVELANRLEVRNVIGFSGCPGDSPTSQRPNWVTCPWPEEYLETLEWQWEEQVIPYWREQAELADRMGVRIAIEPHPGFVVYGTESMLRLRDAVGPTIGCNFDPSHLFWQGIDPLESIKQLGAADAIFHVHAKDTYLDGPNISRNGVLDTKHYSRILERSWTFRTIGYGQGEKAWRDIISTLRAAGYDDVMSIEHEDALLSIDEGLAKAIELLQRLMFKEDRTGMWWA